LHSDGKSEIYSLGWGVLCANFSERAKMNKDQLIKALIQYELQFLIDNPQWLEDTVSFFAAGGFNDMSYEVLRNLYKQHLEVV